jgi:hypothetical protein
MLKQKGVNVGSNPTPTILTWVCRIKEVYSEPATRQLLVSAVRVHHRESPERQPRSPIK